MPSGDNPNSRRNLKPIQPGEIRNPRGVNRKRPVTESYWELSAEPVPLAIMKKFNKGCGAKLLRPGDTWARAVAMRVAYDAAIEGLVAAARELREAIEGKSPQRLEIKQPPRTEVTFRIVHDRRNNRVADERANQQLAERITAADPRLQ